MTTNPPARPARGLPWTLPLLGALGFAAAWVLLSLKTNSPLGWMAVLGALDVAWMLRLSGWRPGRQRLAAGVLGTAATIVLANWWIAASQIGAELGLTPWDSAAKLGMHYAWTIAQLVNGLPGLAWALVALVVAAVASR